MTIYIAIFAKFYLSQMLRIISQSAFLLLPAFIAAVSCQAGSVQEGIKSRDQACLGDLLISVRGMDDDAGLIRANLYDSQGQWENHKGSIMHVAVPVRNGVANVMFSGLPPGRYAVMLYHDRNNNDECDMNFMGLPAEKYGFSNNVRPVFSLPSFESASFLLQCDTVYMEIEVQ